MRYGLVVLVVFGTFALADEPRPNVGEKVARSGDEIVVCGQLYHTTARVVLWTDPGGYDAYRVDRRFAPLAQAGWSKEAVPGLNNPNRYGMRQRGLNPLEIERVRGGGWDLPLLQRVVDQFVIHYDVCGTSRRCFEVLHDLRGLSVHFMLDLDGTIYQTLDLKESAWHATIANGRSIGIEIANMGAYPLDQSETLSKWYRPDAGGKVQIVDPQTGRSPAVADSSIELRPCRDEPIVGTIQATALAAVRLDLPAICRPRSARCHALHDLSQDQVRLSPRRRGRRHRPEAPRRPAQPLPGHPGPLPRSDQQGRPRPGLPVAAVHRNDPGHHGEVSGQRLWATGKTARAGSDHVKAIARTSRVTLRLR